MMEYFEFQGRRFVPVPMPPDLFAVRTDEEIKGAPRVNLPDWDADKYGDDQAPAVYRYSPHPEAKPSEYTVRLPLSWADEYLRINDGNEQKRDYVLATASALFNTREEGEVRPEWGFPVQQYLTMSTNLLRGEAEGDYFRFQTLTPSSSLDGLTHEDCPWLVHRFVIVTQEGRYIDPRIGRVCYFVVSREGYGYMPLSWVRPAGN